MATGPLHHLTRIAELNRQELLDLFDGATALRDDRSARDRHADRIIATLFYEPSTRTRLSFESAALRLGAQVIGFSDPHAASVSKGESLIDTIRTVQRYADLIVLRHPAEGAATLAAAVANVPIINAGDGSHEHPTQTLFDLYTIWQRLDALDGATLGFLGDLKFGRTVHSLAQAASRFGMRLVGIAPEELQLPPYLVERLRGRTELTLTNDLESALPHLDVLYVTRIQLERMSETFRRDHGQPRVLTPEMLRGAKDDLVILHPLPRTTEIDCRVDEDHRAWYFEQVANGVVMRMALLDRLLRDNPPRALGAADMPWQCDDPPWRNRDGDNRACANPQCVTNLERDVMPRWEDDRCTYCDHPAA